MPSTGNGEQPEEVFPEKKNLALVILLANSLKVNKKLKMEEGGKSLPLHF